MSEIEVKDINLPSFLGSLDLLKYLQPALLTKQRVLNQVQKLLIATPLFHNSKRFDPVDLGLYTRVTHWADCLCALWHLNLENAAVIWGFFWRVEDKCIRLDPSPTGIEAATKNQDSCLIERRDNRMIAVRWKTSLIYVKQMPRRSIWGVRWNYIVHVNHLLYAV